MTYNPLTSFIIIYLQAKVESQMASSLAATTQGVQQEPSEAPPPSHFRSTLPVPGSSVPGSSTLTTTQGQDMAR